MQKEVNLRVAETTSRLVGHGIAVIDPKVMEQLGLTSGDVIEITGKKKKSHALLWAGYPRRLRPGTHKDRRLHEEQPRRRH